MRGKKSIIIEEYSEDISTLTGKRKILFDNMKKLHPKGNKKAQMGLCLDLDESRVDYYIKFIFNTEK
jgi:hypothetical protein